MFHAPKLANRTPFLELLFTANLDNEALRFIPSTKFQIIGAGFLRSGAASFITALEILLRCTSLSWWFPNITGT